MFYMCGLILHTHYHLPPSRHRMNYETGNLEHCILLERQKDDENKLPFHSVSVKMKADFGEFGLYR